uniref:Leucine rich immune protein (Coil-less) n=1 Tax=Anopheles christyi TaxID=43041 RepID=A0A240PLQ0_9DIPT
MRFINLRITALNMSLLEQMGLREGSIRVTHSPVHSISLSPDIRLNVLDVEETKLNDITFEENNTHLEKLVISKSLLSKVPVTVAHLATVVYITIKGTPIKIVDLSLFSRLQHLYSIDLSCNRIRLLQYTLASDEDFPNLIEVHLSQNHLEAVNFDFFSRMKVLETLTLSSNRITHVDGSLVSSRLKYLDLSQNSIAAFSCCSWNASKIITLTLNNNTLEQLPACIEEAMANVKFLHLSSNALADGDSIWRRLVSMKRLEALNIDSNQLTSAVLDDVLLSLTFVSLQRNRIKHLRVPFANHGLSITVRCNLIEQFDSESVSTNVTYLDMRCNPVDIGSYGEVQPIETSRVKDMKHVDECRECY